MPTARRSLAARALPALAAFALPALLVACGPGRDQFAPACPALPRLPVADHLYHYRRTGPATGQRDPADLEISGVIVAAGGTCRPVQDGRALAAKLQVHMELTRGPAAGGGDFTIPYFVAVGRGRQILTKQVFATRGAFPAGHTRAILSSAPIEVTVPLAPHTTGADYTIWVGFQLTQAEYAAARAAAR